MKRGFSLIELIIAIAIVTVLAVIGVPNYLGTRNKNRLELASDMLARELNLTMERSRAQEGGYQWWIHFDNPVGNGNDFYVVCFGVYTVSGADCVAEGGTEAKRTNLEANLDFSEPGPGVTKDAVFSKATGLPTATVTVTISLAAGADSKTITVNPNGSIEF